MTTATRPRRLILRHAMFRCAIAWIAGGCAVAGLQPASADTLPTQMRHYQLLEAARARYAPLATRRDLTNLPPLPRRAISSGEAYSGAAALRMLLAALGDLPPASPAPGSVDSQPQAAPAVLDAPLVVALMRFQERHGLRPDGVLGPATWRALTTPLITRLHQIDYTLARWRSLPANPYRRAIFVNIPRFRLYAMQDTEDHEADLLQMDVVVGQIGTKLRTPTFTADLTHLIFRPYWDVPRSIVLAELLPAARRDAGYFSTHHYELVDGAGNMVTYSAARLEELARGSLRVRQRPGPDNALGAVKFVLPNRNGVYLHDTPARALFTQTARAFSHGCVRVANPASLATWLLADDPAWDAGKVEAAMHVGPDEPLRVDLREPVRVYVVYGTAIAREDGSVLFLNDLYGLDKD